MPQVAGSLCALPYAHLAQLAKAHGIARAVGRRVAAGQLTPPTREPIGVLYVFVKPRHNPCVHQGHCQQRQEASSSRAHARRAADRRSGCLQVTPATSSQYQKAVAGCGEPAVGEGREKLGSLVGECVFVCSKLVNVDEIGVGSSAQCRQSEATSLLPAHSSNARTQRLPRLTR